MDDNENFERYLYFSVDVMYSKCSLYLIHTDIDITLSQAFTKII